MLQLEVFIVELGAVDRLSASSIASREITTLDHKLLDDSVESGAFIGERFSGFAFTLLAGAESSEVLGGLGNDVVVQLEADPTFWLVAN